MTITCSHCGAKKSATFKQAASGKPIICPVCGQDMHLPGWQPEQQGAEK